MAKKGITRKEMAITAASIVSLIIAILGLPLGIIAYLADFAGELLACLAVGIGGIGEWLTLKRRLSPMTKAFFGALIIIGALILIFGFGKTSLILMILTQFPFYIAFFLAMCGLWIIIKHRDPTYGLITLIIAGLVLFFYGFGYGVNWEFFAVIAIIILGAILIKRKGLRLDWVRTKSPNQGRR